MKNVYILTKLYMNYTSNNYIHNYILFSLNVSYVVSMLAKNEYQFYFFTVKNQYEKIGYV